MSLTAAPELSRTLPAAPSDPATRPLRVAVLGGGRSCEHEVSLASAASVAAGLLDAGHEVLALTIGTDGSWTCDGSPVPPEAAVAAMRGCDVVFPALHGPHGEDGTAAAWAQLAGVPCVGSGVGAGAVAMDKWVTKLLAQAVGVLVAPGVLLHRKDAATLQHGDVRLPAVVKPVAAGSSRGVHLVRDAAELAAALADAFTYDDRVLVEDVVVGREIDVAVLRLPDGTWRVSPALEIADERFFDYETKYGGDARFVVPAPMDAVQLAALEAAALAVARALGCDGVARVDFFLTDDGPVLNEVNTMPGMTAHSQVPRMFAAAGTDYPALLDLLVRRALAAVVVA
ncbi:MAG: D-alanine--D-alanine ligase [Kineosporiaceae bacterium]